MPLNQNVHQGLFAEAFMYALASAAGFTSAKANLDVDGVDWQIAHVGAKGTTRSPKIEVQVKSWSTPSGSSDAWRFPIAVKHFNRLAGPGFQVPRYLALIIVPPDVSEYATANDELCELRHAAFWASLAMREQLDEGGQETIIVDVPKGNLLTVESLQVLVGSQSAVEPA